LDILPRKGSVRESSTRGLLRTAMVEHTDSRVYIVNTNKPGHTWRFLITEPFN